MPTINSPLRYPGGKAALSDFLAQLIEVNGLEDGVYAEPYAGGAGAALSLLFAERVCRIILNDADPCVYAFWKAVLNQTDQFLDLMAATPVTIEEWIRQREIYRHPRRHSRLRVGFAAFYLNRCNRSGVIVNGGPIGGLKQDGQWKLDARFNRQELTRRVEKVALYRDRISVFNDDALDFMDRLGTNASVDRMLVYLDPPYYVKGSELYLNYYRHEDHVRLAKYVKRRAAFKWVMSYDDVPQIHALYRGRKPVAFNLNYSASAPKIGCELLIHCKGLTMPETPNLMKVAV